MDGRENRMPIGRFAAACRLSIKALRHYDELGLLAPAHVDPNTGYRYYVQRQARAAVLIAMLRSLDLPLATIRTALAASPTELQCLLEAESARLARDLARREQALRSIERIAREKSLTPYAIAVREAPAIPVARITIEADAESLIAASTAAIYRLFDELRAASREPRMPVLCVNEEPDERERIRVHACARVDAPAPLLATAVVDELPGGRFAVCEHVGPYEELGLAHHALFAWTQERGHAVSGPIREVYANDPADVAPAALVTEVWLPI
jgi:DNA-binding transcriptional MerR regulator